MYDGWENTAPVPLGGRVMLWRAEGGAPLAKGVDAALVLALVLAAPFPAARGLDAVSQLTVPAADTEGDGGTTALRPGVPGRAGSVPNFAKGSLKRRSYWRVRASRLEVTSVSSAISAARSAGLTPVVLDVPSAPIREDSFSLYSMNCLRLANCVQKITRKPVQRVSERDKQSVQAHQVRTCAIGCLALSFSTMAS